MSNPTSPDFLTDFLRWLSAPRDPPILVLLALVLLALGLGLWTRRAARP